MLTRSEGAPGPPGAGPLLAAAIKLAALGVIKLVAVLGARLSPPPVAPVAPVRVLSSLPLRLVGGRARMLAWVSELFRRSPIRLPTMLLAPPKLGGPPKP